MLVNQIFVLINQNEHVELQITQKKKSKEFVIMHAVHTCIHLKQTQTRM